MLTFPMPGSGLPPELLHDHDERAVPLGDAGVLLIPGQLSCPDPAGDAAFLAALEAAPLRPVEVAR